MKQCMDSDNLHRRLKKIIGQVQAIDRMVDQDVTSSTAFETGLSMATRTKPLPILQKQLNDFPI
mgnify:CR=1 FL=1